MKAFHQIELEESSRMKTAVKTPWGVYFFKRLAMGLSNSAQTFQRVVEHVLDGLDGVFVYLDDLLIHSKDKQAHMKTLDKLFSKLEKAGMALALDKCQFGKASIDYLGYNISVDGMAPIEKKVSALQKPDQRSKLV